jgi:hypothetical protein
MSSPSDARRSSGVLKSMTARASSKASLVAATSRSPWAFTMERITSSWNSSWLSQMRRMMDALVTRIPWVVST